MISKANLDQAFFTSGLNTREKAVNMLAKWKRFLTQMEEVCKNPKTEPFRVRRKNFYTVLVNILEIHLKETDDALLENKLKDFLVKITANKQNGPDGDTEAYGIIEISRILDTEFEITLRDNSVIKAR